MAWPSLQKMREMVRTVVRYILSIKKTQNFMKNNSVKMFYGELEVSRSLICCITTESSSLGICSTKSSSLSSS